MEKVSDQLISKCPVIKYDPRERLAAAAAAYFPDFPLVGAKQAFYIHHNDGSRLSSYVLTTSQNEFDLLIDKGMPLLLVEVIDDGGYVALKLDFFNC